MEWVIETDRGRYVRYDAWQKTIFVNVKHDAVRVLATPPARIVLLLLAAVSEINRELVPVTDAEEQAVLVDLLRGGSSWPEPRTRRDLYGGAEVKMSYAEGVWPSALRSTLVVTHHSPRANDS